jgi:hypothetical protein
MPDSDRAAEREAVIMTVVRAAGDEIAHRAPALLMQWKKYPNKEVDSDVQEHRNRNGR